MKKINFNEQFTKKKENKQSESLLKYSKNIFTF